MINGNTRPSSKRPFIRRVVRIVLTIASVLLVFVIILLGVLLAYSPGKPKAFLDQNGKPLAGSISEKVFVEIGGVRQGMFIQSKNINNPVLLFLHGGPCFTTYFLSDKYSTYLAEDFTVCYWDERGGGLSYSPEVTLDSMTMEQLMSDTIEVTNYLRERFGQKKIYLMAHSGGTTFGIRVAAKAPELYHAYIGISQISNQGESEKLAYRYLTEQYTKSGNTKMVENLKEYPILDSDTYIIPFFKSLVRDKTMHELGIGTARNMRSIFTGIFLPSWKCRAYTLGEKINIWASKFTFVKKSKLIEQLFAVDLTEEVPKLEIPVYFFSGAYDLTVNHDLSKAYLEKLQAPVKGFYTFEQSAHSPIFEEPEKMQQILQKDVLAGMSSLADTNQAVE